MNTIIKKLTQLTIALAILLQVGVFLAYAQEGNTDSQGNDVLKTELLLQIPAVTDNPNYTLTFKPATDDPVLLSIDGAEAIQIENPYTLPTLGVGRHTLKFDFYDTEEAQRTIETSIIVVPRSPEINAPQDVTNNSLTISGTALPLSTVEIFLTGDAKSFEAEAEVTNTGDWEYTFEEDFSETVYSVVAIVTKNGYGSTFSDPVNFIVGEPVDEDGASITDEVFPIQFSFTDINRDNLQEVIEKNPDLIIGIAGVLIFGLLLGVLFSWLFSSSQEKRTQKMFVKKLQEKSGLGKMMSDKDIPDEEKHNNIRAKLEAAGIKSKAQMMAEEEGVVEQPKSKSRFKGFFSRGKEEKQDAEVGADDNDKQAEKLLKLQSEMGKSISKDEFLKGFKDFDPDPSNHPDPKEKDASNKADKSEDEAGVDDKSDKTEKKASDSESKKKKHKSQKSGDSKKAKKDDKPTKSPKKGDKESAKKIKLSLTSGSLDKGDED